MDRTSTTEPLDRKIISETIKEDAFHLEKIRSILESYHYTVVTFNHTSTERRSVLVYCAENPTWIAGAMYEHVAIKSLFEKMLSDIDDLKEAGLQNKIPKGKYKTVRKKVITVRLSDEEYEGLNKKTSSLRTMSDVARSALIQEAVR